MIQLGNPHYYAGLMQACSMQQNILSNQMNMMNSNSNAGQFSLSWQQDVNASTETAWPVGKNNSMNRKLEAAKKWLKERNATKTTKEA